MPNFIAAKSGSRPTMQSYLYTEYITNITNNEIISISTMLVAGVSKAYLQFNYRIMCLLGLCPVNILYGI